MSTGRNEALKLNMKTATLIFLRESWFDVCTVQVGFAVEAVIFRTRVFM
jgi:hypothetical protein